MRPILIGIAAILLFASVSSAAETDEGNEVRIICGGPTSQQKFEKIRGVLEKETGTKLLLTVNPLEVGISAVSRGLADAATGPFQDIVADAEAKGQPKPNANDFQLLDFARALINIGLNPENPVSALKK